MASVICAHSPAHVHCIPAACGGCPIGRATWECRQVAFTGASDVKTFLEKKHNCCYVALLTENLGEFRWPNDTGKETSL